MIILEGYFKINNYMEMEMEVRKNNKKIDIKSMMNNYQLWKIRKIKKIRINNQIKN